MSTSMLLHLVDRTPEMIDPMTNEKLIKAKKRAIVLSEPPKLSILRDNTGSRKNTAICVNMQTAVTMRTLGFLKKAR